MNTILELRQKRTALWDKAKEFLDSKRTPDGLISEEDSKIYDKMEDEVVGLGKEIERLERQAVIDLELSKAVNNPIKDRPVSNVKPKLGRASDEYAEAFWKAMKSRTSVDV